MNKDFIYDIEKKYAELADVFGRFVDSCEDADMKAFAERCAACTDLQAARFDQVFGKEIKKDEDRGPVISTQRRERDGSGKFAKKAKDAATDASGK